MSHQYIAFCLEQVYIGVFLSPNCKFLDSTNFFSFYTLDTSIYLPNDPHGSSIYVHT